jgi:hypothetical protein
VFGLYIAVYVLCHGQGFVNECVHWGTRELGALGCLLLLSARLCLWITHFAVGVSDLVLMYMFNCTEYSADLWYRCLCTVSWHSYLHIPTRVQVCQSSIAQTDNGGHLVFSDGPPVFLHLVTLWATPRAHC